MNTIEQYNSDKTQLKIVTDTRLWNLLLQGMKKSEKLTKVGPDRTSAYRAADK